MRTHIDIADDLMDAALRAGPYTTKKDAVEAGLRMLARQAHYREILRWQGRLTWDGDDPSPASPARRRPPAAPGTDARSSAAVKGRTRKPGR